MLAGLLLLEMLSIGLFAASAHPGNRRIACTFARTSWLAYESTSLALQIAEALLRSRAGWIDSLGEK